MSFNISCIVKMFSIVHGHKILQANAVDIALNLLVCNHSPGIAVCVHVCACTGDGSSCLLELHAVLGVQPMAMLTSVSCTTSRMLCTTMNHLHKAMESHTCIQITCQ